MSFRSFLCLMLLFVVLGGCVAPWKTGGLNTVPRMPLHESWCYKTLAQIDCYPAPQDISPGNLVSVDPPSRFPLTAEAHAKALAESRKVEEKP